MRTLVGILALSAIIGGGVLVAGTTAGTNGPTNGSMLAVPAADSATAVPGFSRFAATTALTDPNLVAMADRFRGTQQALNATMKSDQVVDDPMIWNAGTVGLDTYYAVSYGSLLCVLDTRGGSTPKLVAAECSPPKDAANPATPLGAEDSTGITFLLPDAVASAALVGAGGETAAVAVEGNLAHAKVDFAPASLELALNDGTTAQFVFPPKSE